MGISKEDAIVNLLSLTRAGALPSSQDTFELKGFMLYASTHAHPTLEGYERWLDNGGYQRALGQVVGSAVAKVLQPPKDKVPSADFATSVHSGPRPGEQKQKNKPKKGKSSPVDKIADKSPLPDFTNKLNNI